MRALRIRELRSQLAAGLDQAERGELIDFDEVVVERVKGEGRRKLVQKRASRNEATQADD